MSEAENAIKQAKIKRSNCKAALTCHGKTKYQLYDLRVFFSSGLSSFSCETQPLNKKIKKQINCCE